MKTEKDKADPLQNFYSLGELANRFSCSEDTIRKYIREGLQAKAMGGKTWIHVDEVERFLRAQDK